MATPSRAEVERAFEHYLQVGAYDRNWNAWADLFTEDALYIEPQYGTFHGREAIRKWILETMAKVPDMYFPPMKWRMIDGDMVAFCIDNVLPNPAGGEAFAFPTVTILRYRDGLWSYEEDVYDVRMSERAKAAFSAARARA
jgi:hypothetical protein